MPNVHIAFGFHVNCYHSYRGDAPDATGFGSDIRIIRRIIEQLNALNEKGVPVKGTWDFENAYSLEDILPEYAPDIIEGVKERVLKWGDENIIMGYNNGALGAMTPDELEASVNWAITNEKGSGLEDIFGSCAKIVRPQEVMFTPSQVRDYKRLGIDALALYYSCVPFDAFRTITPQLPDAFAFNPVRYTWEGESLTVIPTYSNADLIDAGSLRVLVHDLHDRQERGEIETDVLVFVNMDADAPFWEPLGLPWPANKIPNTMGVGGLAEEVAGLDYVVFDTPGGYLKTHLPLAEVTFGHDTADGSYTGYSSWAEKPFNRLVWGRIERARAIARSQDLGFMDQASPGFAERVNLLSTTHFGLASPVLNIDRERRALSLSEEMLRKEMEAQAAPERLTIVNPGGSGTISIELCFAPGWLPQIENLNIAAEGLQTFGGIALSSHEDGSVNGAFVLCKFEQAINQVELNITNDALPCPLNPEPSHLSAGGLTLRVCEHGEILSVDYNGNPVGGKDFMRGYLSYGGKDYPLTNRKRAALPMAGQLQGLRVEAGLHLPGELRPGQCRYDFFTLPGFGGILIHNDITYPYTEETYAISTASSALGRYYDVRWQQAAPFQLTPRLPGGLHVVKRNFSHEISDYPVAAFRESVPENENLDSFNHQLTGGFVGLSNGETGLLLANARQISGSMAHCPMRLRRTDAQDTVSLNPFGTYAGKQRIHPSRGNGSIAEAFVIVAPQSRSLAPAYNGARETAVMALFGYEGLRPGGDILQQACAFADGAVPLCPADSPVKMRAATEDHVSFMAAREVGAAAPRDSTGDGGQPKLQSIFFSGALPSPAQMARTGVRAVSHMIKANRKAR